MKWIGRRQSIGIAKEASRGVGVAPTYWLNVLSFNFKDVPVKALSEASFGRITGGDQSPLTMIHGEGDMEVELGDQSFGLILYALLGTLATSGPTDTSAYTHAFSLANTNQHQSLSITTTDPIGDLMYELAMISSLEIAIIPDTIISYKVDFLSKGSAGSSGNTASYSSENKFVGRNLTFKVAANTAGLAAASETKVKSLTITFEKNAEINATLSTLHPEDVCNKMFDVKGEIVLDYEDRTFFDYITADAYKAIRIDLLGTTLITGAGSTFPEWTLDLSKVSFDTFEPDFSPNEIVTQTLLFNALYDAGGNDNVINACSLINEVASY